MKHKIQDQKKIQKDLKKKRTFSKNTTCNKKVRSQKKSAKIKKQITLNQTKTNAHNQKQNTQRPNSNDGYVLDQKIIKKIKQDDITTNHQNNKLQKEIQNLKKKIKIQEQKNKRKKIIQNTSFIRNKIICINTKDMKDNELEKPLIELLHNQKSKQKNQEIFYTRETIKIPKQLEKNSQKKDDFKEKSLDLGKPKKNLDFMFKKKSLDLSKKIRNSSQQEKKKQKIKIKNKEDSKRMKGGLLRCQQKNSLKNLLDQYKSLKDGESTCLNKIKLEKMKSKIEEIYCFIEKKLEGQQKLNIMNGGKVLSKKRNDAAIKIQKVFRGYLIRKIFEQAILESYKSMSKIKESKNMKKYMEEQNQQFTKSFNLSKNMNIFTFAKQSIDYTQQCKFPIVYPSKYEWIEQEIFYLQKNNLKQAKYYSRLLNQELKGWQQQKKVVDQLEIEVTEKFTQEKKIQKLFQKMKKVIFENLNKIQNNKNFIEKLEVQNKQSLSKISNNLQSNQFYSKDQMDVWRPIIKLPESIVISQYFDKDIEIKSEQGFFYTERSKRNKSPINLKMLVSCESQQTISKCNDKQKPKQQSSKNSSIKMNSINHQQNLDSIDNQKFAREYKKDNNIEDNFEELEFIEVPLKPYFNIDIIKSNEFQKLIFNALLNDILQETIWKSYIYFMNNIHEQNISQQESENNTIYGIRTNSNAVREYSNLLIRYIEEKYLDELIYNILNISFKKSPQNINKKSFSEFQIFEPNSLSKEIMQRYCKKFLNKQKNKEEIVWKIPTENNFLLTQNVYLELESQILDNYTDQNIMEELFEMQRVYHRCLFDCFNEILYDQLSNNPHKICTLQKQLTNNNKDKKIIIENFLLEIKSISIDYSQMLCGIIKDKEDSMFDSAIKNFNESSFKGIREDKLKSLLYLSILDSQKQFKMSNIGFLIKDLGILVEEYLIDDTVDFFFNQYQLKNYQNFQLKQDIDQIIQDLQNTD